MEFADENFKISGIINTEKDVEIKQKASDRSAMGVRE